MSNGEQCCALEICCGGAEAREKTADSISKTTGTGLLSVLRVLDWMDQNGLVFAPASFKPAIAEVVDIVRKHDTAG